MVFPCGFKKAASPQTTNPNHQFKAYLKFAGLRSAGWGQLLAFLLDPAVQFGAPSARNAFAARTFCRKCADPRNPSWSFLAGHKKHKNQGFRVIAHKKYFPQENFSKKIYESLPTKNKQTHGVITQKKGVRGLPGVGHVEKDLSKMVFGTMVVPTRLTDFRHGSHLLFI